MDKTITSGLLVLITVLLPTFSANATGANKGGGSTTGTLIAFERGRGGAEMGGMAGVGGMGGGMKGIGGMGGGFKGIGGMGGGFKGVGGMGGGFRGVGDAGGGASYYGGRYGEDSHRYGENSSRYGENSHRYGENSGRYGGSYYDNNYERYGTSYGRYGEPQNSNTYERYGTTYGRYGEPVDTPVNYGGPLSYGGANAAGNNNLAVDYERSQLYRGLMKQFVNPQQGANGQGPASSMGSLFQRMRSMEGNYQQHAYSTVPPNSFNHIYEPGR